MGDGPREGSGAPLISDRYRNLIGTKHSGDPSWGSTGALWAPIVAQLADKFGARDILDYGCGKQTLAAALDRPVRGYDPAFPETSGPPEPADLVVCTDVLEHVEPEHLDAVLQDLERVTRRVALFVVSTRPAVHLLPDGRNAHLIVEPPEWWAARLGRRFEILLSRVTRPGEVLFVAGARKPAAAAGDPLRVFVGSEPRRHAAERVLLHSLAAHASIPLDVTVASHDRGGPWSGWEMGRPATGTGTPAPGDPRRAWFTDFANFRWAVPELCRFEGRAVYMDADCLVLGDVAELAAAPLTAPVAVPQPNRPAVILFDCAAFAALPGWPRLEAMKRNGWPIQRYLELLNGAGAFGPLPAGWYCRDGDRFEAGATRLIHFAELTSQPWRPYPDRFTYRPHPRPEIEALWWRWAEKARAAGAVAGAGAVPGA